MKTEAEIREVKSLLVKSRKTNIKTIEIKITRKIIVILDVPNPVSGRTLPFQTLWPEANMSMALVLQRKV